MNVHRVAGSGMAVVAAVLFVVAVTHEELAGLAGSLAAICAVASILGWFTPRRTDVDAAQRTARQWPGRRAAGWIFVVSSLLVALIVLFLPWKSRKDFDVTGILWLLENGAFALLLGIAAAAAVAAAVIWFRAGQRSSQSAVRPEV